MQQKGLDFGGEPVRPAKRRALTVTELTDRIQGVLETEFFDVWVEGEVSNLTIAASGHWYFSLKDDHAQVPRGGLEDGRRASSSSSRRTG